jgi:hypothetical protein
LPWLLGNQKKYKATTLAMVARQTEEAKATIVLLYDKPAQQPQVFKVPD